MAFPGDRKIVQHARGVADDFDATVLEDGEICILMAEDLGDWEIRVGDGITPGGGRFMSKEYVDVVAGNGGIQQGTDDMASIGTDTEQRTWPATSFSLFAKRVDAILEGAPVLDTQPSNGDTSLRIANTGWVANNFKKLGYLGTNVDETSFPIGHTITVNGNGNTPSRNQTPTATLRVSAASTQEYIMGGAGVAVAGTWRSRGRAINTGGDNSFSYERVA